jgi:flavin reductase (DIM6/NTAB) family NADH-FMN oxidoreductase RutF
MAFDARGFRNVLGRFPTGIAVVTCEPPGGMPVAMTINSFASVSLDPPLVLWSLDLGSECLPAFQTAPGYAVHFLTDEQQDLSVRFSKKDNHGLETIAYRTGKSGAPILDQCHAWLDCTIHARHEGGDHVILVGEVQALGEGDGNPLIYYRGSYRGLAEKP